MSIFLRDLPLSLQLNPRDQYQFVSTPDNILCNTLHLYTGFDQFDKTNLIPSSTYSIRSGIKRPFILGNEQEYALQRIYLILDELGSLFLLFFFNSVYQRFPILAIQSLEQGFQFNYYFYKIAILQALNRLSYAFYGLDYEEFRNHQDIKTRSVIEDFHSILGSILVLPLKTEENLGEIWSPGLSKHQGGRYSSYIISEQAYFMYETRLYEFVLKSGKRLLAPFNEHGKLDVGNSYGEFRALRNPITNYTYLYKSFLPQPQNCEYQDVEIEKMGIKTSFEYKEIFPFHPKTDRKSSPFKETTSKEMQTAYSDAVMFAPEYNSWYTKNNSNSLDNEKITLIHLPEELKNLWEEGGKEITAILKGEKELPIPIIESLDMLETKVLLKNVINSVSHLRHLKALELDRSKFVSTEHPKYIQEQRYFRVLYDAQAFLGYFTQLSKDKNRITKDF